MKKILIGGGILAGLHIALHAILPSIVGAANVVLAITFLLVLAYAVVRSRF